MNRKCLSLRPFSFMNRSKQKFSNHSPRLHPIVKRTLSRSRAKEQQRVWLIRNFLFSSWMWLYLPALGMAKELVAEQQEQSFAGSTFSYKDVGSREMGDKYNAQLSSEDTVTIDGEDHSVYVLALTAKPDSDADYPTGKMWVDKEGFIMLKSEDYNESGNLELSMEVAKLGEFEGEVIADQMVSTNVLDGSSTTITFLERKRPEGEFSEDLFDPENLASFDPAEYGF